VTVAFAFVSETLVIECALATGEGKPRVQEEENPKEMNMRGSSKTPVKTRLFRGALARWH